MGRAVLITFLISLFSIISSLHVDVNATNKDCAFVHEDETMVNKSQEFRKSLVLKVTRIMREKLLLPWTMIIHGV